ncbi:MAG: hypothetical protein Q7T11_02830 [Deltaproteobacteria bacterium]|nr:hypothetical protein [Deltaproteobacteria bacterium]
METEIFLMVIVFASSFWYLGGPLLKGEGELSVDPGRNRQNLSLQKDEVLLSLKEIELDYQMKKISEEDYKEQYAEAFEEGKSILKKLNS